MKTTLPEGISLKTVERIIDAALAEDLGEGGDITSNATIPEDARFSGVMAARHAMVVAGLDLAGLVFKRVSADIVWIPETEDGVRVQEGAVLARVEGPARALLSAERTALNLLQHLSGIATLTRQYVEAVAGTGAVILDTRKTLPGYRELAKYATRMGGAQNHRMRLDDAVLIKDNHIAAAGGLATAVNRAREAGHGPIEVECDTLIQVEAALNCGVDAVLLDNMSISQLREAVHIVGRAVRTEASGGVTLEKVRAIAETGVQTISVGRITQSAPAVDIGLDWNPGA
ncbi:MAG: carboxylating nicotinate-nucleotide diphosphorylase [Alphaproteobacteria bacterium]|nr:carboxylating nicotinate-nucleotide diphosphorylase [Alphaproteobacteria bacterium]MBF0250040.1 carboxylating nicotinate-nucleotide diphosphorylase [Alphaproteobacteria bacterium]